MVKNLWFLAAALLMLLGVNATAQRYGDDYYYRHWGREPLDRVRGDLNRAERNLSYLSEDEMRRFRHIREAINDFQRNWERGRYDGPALDETIGGLHALVDRSKLHQRDRDVLADDLHRLRDLRDRWEHRDRDRY
jgi:hypothetical protein